MVDTNSFDGLVTNFITGADLDEDKAQFLVSECSINNLPDGTPQLVLDVVYNGENWKFALNKTNAKKLKELVSAPKDIRLKTLNVKKVLATNPQTKKEVEAIRIDSIA